jgi:RND family efflux transporter MFP subunit
VTVIVSAVGEEPFTGTIATISPAADSLSSTFPISIEISNSEHKLKPGMFAEAKLVLETKEGVLVLPKQAVIDSGDKKYVYVVKDNKAIQTEITTGIEDDERVEIVSGLQAGDMIVLSGQNKLQNETPVTVSGGK